MMRTEVTLDFLILRLFPIHGFMHDYYPAFRMKVRRHSGTVLSEHLIAGAAIKPSYAAIILTG
jgi:hypothetical protein